MDAVYRIDLREYLARGVGALVSARAEHWVFGHCGAALLAGVWLLREGRLTPPSAERLARRLEETVSADPNRYRLPEPRAPGCLDLLIEDLHENIATLRNSAHGTIYIAAALQALSEQPRLATAQTIESLRHVYRNAQTPDPDRYFDIENHAEVDLPCEAPPVHRDDREIIVSCLLALEPLYPDQIIAGKRYFYTGEKLHLLTHAQALFRLEALGHPELKWSGGEALRRQIYLCQRRPPVASSQPGSQAYLGPKERKTEGPADAEYWTPGEDPWHDIKFAQAVSALLPTLSRAQRDQVDPALKNAWAALAS